MGFLKALFGPSKDEVWAELAKQIDGQFIQTKSFWAVDSRVRVEVGEWTITLDSYSTGSGKNRTVYTRFRAPFCNTDNLRFNISRADFLSPIGRALGFQDIEIGDKYFDDEYIIKGNNVALIQAFFANERLRHLIEAQSTIHLRIAEDTGWFGSNLPEGVDELTFTRRGIMRDLEELRGIFEIFAASLNQLCRIGAAYENDPDFFY